MRLKAIFAVTICVVSCDREKPATSIYKNRDFILVDSSEKANVFLSFDRYSSDYPIYYIGPKVDTINIGKRYWRERTQWIGNSETSWSTKYSNESLDIFVDTAIKTSSSTEYFSENSKIARDSKVDIHSFLISITNTSDSTIYLGRSFSLFLLHREVKDRNGAWVKIEKKLCELENCLTTEPSIMVRLNEVVISKLKRYKGSFVTDFRLAFGYQGNTVYSNIWRDSIDERVFDIVLNR